MTGMTVWQASILVCWVFGMLFGVIFGLFGVSWLVSLFRRGR